MWEEGRGEVSVCVWWKIRYGDDCMCGGRVGIVGGKG